MTGIEWLRRLERIVQVHVADVEITHTDDATISLALGLRIVVAHVIDDVAILAPSFSAGGTIGSRLESRVQHLDVTSFGMDERSADAAAAMVVAHHR